MRTWFLTKVQYSKENEEGLLKNVTEEYLFDATSFTETEELIYKEFEQRIRGDFQIKSIVKSNYVDVFLYEDSDLWHSCKVVYKVVDSDSGREKKVSQFMLVTAANVDQAFERINESLNNMLVSFSIPEIKEKEKIMEVFPYAKEESAE